MNIYAEDTYDAKAERDGALSALDRELGRLDEAIAQLAKQLDPIIRHVPHPESDEAQVRDIAGSQLRERADRVSIAVARLHNLTQDIDL